VARGFEQGGGVRDVVGFGGAVGGYGLGKDLVFGMKKWMGISTLVSASGSTKRCRPRDLTKVRDLCASTATLRREEVLEAFFLGGFWFVLFGRVSLSPSSFPEAVSCD
jgi:hypothetical protein